MSKVHELKVLEQFMLAIIDGTKTFEVRLNDRDYQIGDWLLLKEWDGRTYSGIERMRSVIYVLQGGQFGIQDGYCVLGIRNPY